MGSKLVPKISDNFIVPRKIVPRGFKSRDNCGDCGIALTERVHNINFATNLVPAEKVEPRFSPFADIAHSGVPTGALDMDLKDVGPFRVFPVFRFAEVMDK